MKIPRRGKNLNSCSPETVTEMSDLVWEAEWDSDGPQQMLSPKRAQCTGARWLWWLKNTLGIFRALLQILKEGQSHRVVRFWLHATIWAILSCIPTPIYDLDCHNDGSPQRAIHPRLLLSTWVLPVGILPDQALGCCRSLFAFSKNTYRAYVGTENKNVVCISLCSRLAPLSYFN